MIQVIRETHEAPAGIARRLELAGGVNRFGEPNFRAVWGASRLGWIGGRWTDLNESGAVIREIIGVRYTQKYFPHNRWHIERWCAPESYGSPENWARQTLEIEDGRNIAALGPYPSRGEYEHVFTLESFPSASARSANASQGADSRGASNGAANSQSGETGGEFVQLTPAIAERLARMIEAGRGTPKREGRESLYRREAARDREYDSWADAVLSR